MVKLEAHRGVSTEYPENTIPSILAAIRQGYDMIELDVDVTRDSELVLMHDRMINRTARFDDGGELLSKISVREIDYEELQKFDFGIWFAKKFKGTRAPKFREVLEIAREHKIKIKIDNKYRTFEPHQRMKLYRLIGEFSDVATLTCYTIEDLKEAIENLPESVEYHFDGFITDENLEEVSKLLPKDRVTIWIPFKNKATDWVKVDFVNDSLAEKIKEHGKLGLWLLLHHTEYEEAKRLGADIIETNGKLKPECANKITADMHTHSEFSHDSTEKIENTAKVEAANEVKIFAVTDHCDTFRYTERDIETPLREAKSEIERLRRECNTDVEILHGVEIGEAFWTPNEVRERINYLLPYDVILGSVHLVYGYDGETTIALRDYGKMTDKEIFDYLDSYFNDITTLLNTTDFDILSHLTIPMKYIFGKYRRNIDLSLFDEKIDYILDYIIAHGIALECNTSTIASTGEPSPSRDILKRYFDKGGYLITLGSDAHTATAAAKDFDVAKKILRDIGFYNIFYYKERNTYFSEV